MNSRQFYRGLILFSFWMLTGISGNLYSQTKGLIVRPAASSGREVLDPNNDGYTSKTNAGFKNNDEDESELPLQRLVLPFAEPTSDTRTGPACGFTDFVDAPGVYSSSYYAMTVNNGDTNLVFRFRIGNFAPNSKGYSILIDTDGKFGFSGTQADPNAVPGNPGFEMEIILVTNFGVRLYNTDGTTNPTLLTTLPYNQYAQISIAHSENCNNDDYFYDFFMPLATIQQYFPSFNSATPVRMVANTVINTLSALRGGISDMSGIDDDSGNPDRSWETLISYAIPTPAGQAGQQGFPPVRTIAPAITGPIYGGATTVSGTSSEEDGTLINLYNDGVLIGSAVVMGGAWTVNGLTALEVGEVLTATAEAPGKSVSALSNPLAVGGNCTAAPEITCLTTKGLNLANSSGNWPVGTVLRVYFSNNGSFGAPIYTQTVDSETSSKFMKCNENGSNCNSGPNCQSNGTYFATAQEPGKCESPMTLPSCLGNQTTTPSHSITSSLEPGVQTVSGTKGNTHEVFLFVNGYLAGTYTANGTSWSIPSVNIPLGATVSLYSKDGSRCLSASLSQNVTQPSDAPVVNGPLVNGTSVVTGTSTEDEGTTITVYKNGVSIGSTTVQADGTWTLSGISPNLLTGQNIHATATATGKSVSANSNTVTVLGASTPPVIVGNYKEQDVSVSGTSVMPDGTIIRLYIDEYEIGTAVVSGGTWTVSGLSAQYYDLYAGGALNATATGAGLAESAFSNTVIVDCNPPNALLPLSVVGGNTCLATSASIELPNSELYVIYTIQDINGTSNKGSSVLGTGGNIVLATFRLANSESFLVQAKKIPGNTCTVSIADTANVIVLYPPDTSGILPGDYLWVGVEADSLWEIAYNWVQWSGSEWILVENPPTDSNNVLVKPVQTCIPQFPIVVNDTISGYNSACRNFTIDNNAVVYMQSSENDPKVLTVKGNWTNRGTFVPANGTVIFNGNQDQRIYSASGTEYFNHFVVQGDDTKVILDVDVEVDTAGSITFEAGIVDLNGHTFTLFNNNVNALIRDEGYFYAETRDGSAIFRRKIGENTGSYLFPFGNALGQYVPVEFTLNDGDIGMAGVSTYFAALDTSETYPAGPEAIPTVPKVEDKVRRFWHFYTDQAPGSFDVNVAVVYAPDEAPVNGVIDQTSEGLRAFRWDAAEGKFDTSFSKQIYQHNFRKLVIQNIDRFSWWGAGQGEIGPLPVDLAAFSSGCQKGKNLIRWKTMSEINNAYFLIQKSTDGMNWETLARIEGAGTTSSARNYQWTDMNPQDLVYYRLVQVDFDGGMQTWGLLAQSCESMQGTGNLFPNPAVSGMQISLFHEVAVPETISWISAEGKVMHVAQLMPGNNHALQVPKLPAGVYLLKTQSGWTVPCLIVEE